MITANRTRFGALAIAALFVASACSGGGSTPSASSTGGTSSQPPASTEASASAAAASGQIKISGSSTVQPISQGVAEDFNAENPGVAITVDGPGTGDGFKLFCKGDTDISDASRPIKDEEKTLCQQGGVEYIELKIAIDGISVLTSVNDSKAPDCLSFADLYALTGPESEGFKNWKDAQALATKVGSTTQFPDVALTVSGPGEESGTYDYFVETVITPIAEEQKLADDKLEVTRKDYQSSPNDNVIIQNIAGADGSLGWVGYAYAEQNTDKVKFFKVAKEEGKCVEPTPETIASNEYPLSRNLFIYVNKAKVDSNPALAPFVDFYLKDGTITAVNEDVGYIDLAPDVLAQSRSTWEGR